MKNVLFLAIDDLNDWTNGLKGYSGNVSTPNLDALMDSGVTFNNAYSQVALCNPSRASVLSGKSPLKTQIFNNRTDWESTVNPSETLFGVMKQNGYQSVGTGKLFHSIPSAESSKTMFDSYSYLGTNNTGINLAGKPVGPYNGTTTLSDENRADYTTSFLKNYTPDPNKPLFLSTGFIQPHIPWVVPQKYFDLYPLDSIKIDAVPNDRSDIPQFALDNVGQSLPWSQADVPDLLTWKKLIQGYLASISYMDAQVGKVLDALDNSAIADNTSVVLWSDHGYHLGDKDFWHKFTLWDNAAKAPLIIRDPDITNPGTVIDDVVELSDIFPTILDLTGISKEGLELDGKSLVPKINGTSDSSVPNRAFTWMYGSVSLRTDEYRYTIYEDGSEELYDVVNDPELTVNLADDSSLTAVKDELNSTILSEFNLVGYGSTDSVLNGSNGNDLFAINDANQTANGGAGDDIYFVRGNTSLVEAESGGRDMVVTSLENYTMPANVEVLEVKNVSQQIFGNSANNLITANSIFIDSGEGDDTVRVGFSTNRVYLGEGDDFLNSNTYAGKDTIYGGGGNDTIEFLNGDSQFVKGEFGDDKIVLSFGNDTVKGGDGNDSSSGANGNDFIQGEGGNDLISGGNGDDSLQGGQSSDRLFGGLNNDQLDGGSGNDSLYSGIGNDSSSGANGNDFIQGEGGNDLISGGNGDDSLQGGQSSDRLFGGLNNDQLDGGSGNDFFYSGIGNDVANGGLGNDFIQGEWGNDTLDGGGGADTLEGNQNSDIFAYTDASDSSVSQPDKIKDFGVGIDKLWLDFPDFAPTEIVSVTNIDEANTYFDGSSIQVAFSAVESILYIDSTIQGVADMAISLEGVTSLSLNNLSLLN